MLKKTNLIEKKNVLNEIRKNSMTLQELRFFSIYLSKINAREKATRVVRFPLSDFQRIMELGRMNIQHIKQITDSLLMNIVHLPDEKGGYTSFQLFKKCTISQDDYGEWYVEIDAHDDALPLMFDFKKEYFTYELWNALRLKSANQVRMYEILKQYEKLGKRELRITELRELLGIATNEYPRFGDFKNRVLNPCQQALAENTDIKFEYNLLKKGAKVVAIEFLIQKNNNYIDQLTLEQFIDLQADETIDEEIDNEKPLSKYDKKIEFLAEACDNEFSINETIILYDIMQEILPQDVIQDDFKSYHFLKRKFDELRMRAEKSAIKNRFSYLTTLVKTGE